MFWVNLPVGVGGRRDAGPRCSTRSSTATPRRIDYAGAALLMVGVGALLVAMVQAESLGARDHRRCSPSPAPPRSPLLARHEARVAEPIVPFRLWRHPLIAIGNFGSLTIGVMMMCNARLSAGLCAGRDGPEPGRRRLRHRRVLGGVDLGTIVAAG